MRRSGFFWAVLVLVSGTTNFIVKNTVQGLDDELTNVRRKTVVEQKEIHELTADWTFLNQPELLADLNKRYVGLVPVSSKQVAPSIDAIPLRPAPPADPIPPSAAAAPLAPEAAPVAPEPASPTAIVPVAATVPLRPSSLDAIFAHVAGDR